MLLNKADSETKLPVKILTYHFVDYPKIWRHLNEYLEVIYLVKGEITFKTENKIFCAKENDIVVFNDFGIYESISFSQENEYFVFAIPPEFFKSCEKIENGFNKNIIRHDEECLLLAKKAAEIADENEQADQFLLNARVFELLHKITQWCLFSAQTENKQVREVKYSVDAVKNRIECCYSEPLDITALANSLCISVSHLQHTFKKQTGYSLIGYTNKVRIENAARLLEETSLRISEISFRAGFSDYNYFSRVFKKITGKTPSQYRTINK